MTDKWQMNRLGLVDFWYYANEEFKFADGHMLLRGSNGSGKSVTMQSIVPLLLDGNRSSSRLDPFGTKARRIEDYLIDESGKHDNRIGYLYLEFKKADKPLYITIGMGIHAIKNQKLDVWYFVIEDNRRVMRDLSLLEKQKTLTKQELKNRIGKDQFIETQKLYMERVNKVLFGFDSVNEYKEAIDLLLQLRAPKLSNTFKPTMLNDLLSSSLQALSDDDLRFMSDAITSMDETNDQLESLKKSSKAATAILKQYDRYNRVLLKDKLQAYLIAKKAYDNLDKLVISTDKELAKTNTEVLELQALEKEMFAKQRSLQEKLLSLTKSDTMELFDQVQQLTKLIKEMTDQKESLVLRHETASNQMIDQEQYLKLQRDIVSNLHDEITQTTLQLDEVYEQWPFEEHQIVKDAMINNIASVYDYSYTSQQLEKKIKLVNELHVNTQILHVYQQSLTDQEDRLELLDQEIYDQDKLIKEHEYTYQGVIEKYKDHLVLFSHENRYLRVSNESIQEQIKTLMDYEKTRDYSRIIAPVDSLKETLLQKLDTKKMDLSFNVRESKKLLGDYQHELHTWQNIKHIIPERDELAIKNRHDLKLQGIPYISLYELLDFSSDVSQDERNQIEAILKQTNLLDVLVVHDQHRTHIMENQDDLTDHFLFTTTPIDSIEPFYIHRNGDINELFELLGCAPLSLSKQDNSYTWGPIDGIVSSTGISQFIGQSSRQQFRDQQIAKFTKLANEERQLIESYQTQLNQLEIECSQIETEYLAFLSSHELDQVLDAIKGIEDAKQHIYFKIESVRHEMLKIKHGMHEVHSKLSQLCEYIGIENNESSYQSIESLVTLYLNGFNKLKDDHKDYLRSNEQIISLEQTLMHAQEVYDNLSCDLQILCDKIQSEQILLESKEELLNDTGYESIKVELEQTQTKIAELKIDATNTHDNIIRYQNNIEHLLIKQDENATQLKDLYNVKANKHLILAKEADLGFVVEQNWDIKMLSQIESDKISLLEITNNLTEAIQINKIDLEEYRLENQWKVNDEHDVEPRFFIQARYASKMIDLKTLVENLDEDCHVQQNLLVAADRHLFEDILISTVAKKIRHNIQRSRRWVDTMNEYMDEMNTSSGLKLRLQWKPHQSQNTEQMNTRELVDLLSSDELLLSQTDKNKISLHFRSKIQQAKELSDVEGYKSFHQIMKEIMDYRSWFTFITLYEKGQAKRKELTNNAFAVFSGGEKAMSMYIPLFSAVAAKFSSANQSAPTIIALDEAFAGVDELNIDNMFKLIEKFKFDYIINSQILWGDYASVKSLAIYELHRPNDADYVTVMSYHWNGLVREYIEREQDGGTLC